MSDWLPRDLIAPVTEAEHEAVRTAQRALRVEQTGLLDESTKAALRGAQRLFGLPVTGYLDRPTAQALDRLRPPSLRE